ncbi:hypothetical protein OH77DRAFT_1425348 [Trametes cingulata]|nr:hypothetical protein OH77DRAFT_1425348 [Trametes cingulata]
MELSNFVMRFDAERSGLIDAVRIALLTGRRETQRVTAELYKLNVYGKGAFFKPHVDTPHAPNMFGSLVIVFPSPHEGGELVIRHQGRTWTFSSAELLSGSTSSIAWIAFFSDVEHEVLPVLSGHRVTVTYNLYLSPNGPGTALPDGLTILQPPHANPSAIADALRAFLSNEKVLPQGGILGFGLRHVYPLPRTWDESDDDPLDVVERFLKGSDAALYQACEELGLNPRLRLIAEAGPNYIPVMLNRMVTYGDEPVSDDEEALLGDKDVQMYEDKEFQFADDDNRVEDDEDDHNGSEADKDDGDKDGDTSSIDSYEKQYGRRIPIYWVTKCEEGKSPGTSHQYVSYGNEASTSYLYVSVCLVAEVESPEKRKLVPMESDEGEEGSHEGGDE